MTVAVAALGWLLVAALVVELRRRSALLADAAHELRGPLTSMSLGLETLRARPVAGRTADALLFELGRLQAATDDVAAAARGRRACPRARPLDPHAVVKCAGDAWRPAAERRGGRVLLQWDAGSRRINADPRRLAQVLGNLLSNAVEHGGADVMVRSRVTGDALRVEVVDRGPGSDAPDRGERGHGRGLAIARRSLEQAGGRLETRPRAGGGRIAVAEIPLERGR